MLFANPAKDFKEIKSQNGQKTWEPFMKRYHCDRICELGVFKGGNFLELVKHKPKLAVAVDNWKNAGVHSKAETTYTSEQLKSQYRHFYNLVKNFAFVQIVRDSTLNAAKLFPKNYFDFVYVDADHEASAYYRDLVAWYPKIKWGKFLVGHDYKKGYGVVDAVNRFTRENKLELVLLPASNWMVVKV